MEVNDAIIEALNALDEGIITEHLTVQQNEEIKISEDEMYNPFYKSLGDSNDLTAKEIYNNYKKIYCMSIKEGITNPPIESIFKNIIKKSDYAELSKYLTIKEVSNNIFKNYSYYKKYFVIEKEHLEQFNKNYKLDSKEIVILFLELNEKSLELYLSLYDEPNNINDIIEIINLTNLYANTNQNKSHDEFLTNKICEYIKNMENTNYWMNDNNCKMNYNSNFEERVFRLKDANKSLEDKNIQNVVDKIVNAPINKGDPYQEVINKDDNALGVPKNANDVIYKANKFVDTSSNNKTNEKSYYPLNQNNVNLKKETINTIFTNLNNMKILESLFDILLISKEYCHLVVNNKVVLDKMTDIINKKLYKYKVLFGYAWNTFYTEECIIRSGTTKDHRYVFDINTVNKLPFFPFILSDLKQNPYFSMFVSDKNISEDNCWALPMMINKNINPTNGIHYGTTNLDNFKSRLNVFLTGKSENNLLEGINWDNLALSGSLIPACVQQVPFQSNILKNFNFDNESWNDYFDEYYSNSDVDVMCNKDSMFEFMDKVLEFKNIVYNNMNKNIPDDKKENINIECKKTCALVMHKLYIQETLEKINTFTGKEYTVDDIIIGIDNKDPILREYFYKIYTDMKFKSNLDNRKTRQIQNVLYNDFYKLTSIDDINLVIVDYELNINEYKVKDNEICCYMNEIRKENNKPELEKNILVLKLSETVKFKLHSKALKHSFEIFKIKNKDFFSTVSHFHLPCVRAYYTGENVHLLPSCITAMMTGINIEYKYFAGMRDPIDIINKYRMRGYGTILNESEKKTMIEYNIKIDKWKNIFTIGPDATNPVYTKYVLMPQYLHSNLYKPQKYLNNNIHDKYNQSCATNIFYVIAKQDLENYYKDKYGYDKNKHHINIFNLKTINENGDINPIKKWILDAF